MRIPLKHARTLPYVKQTTSESSRHEAGHPKLVFWNNPEGWGGKRGGRGILDRGSCVYLWLIHVDVWQNPLQYCKVIMFQSKSINRKKRICSINIERELYVTPPPGILCIKDGSL